MGGQQVASGFQVQFQNFMYYAGPIAQLLFWAAVGISAIWAALTLKRYVDFMTGKTVVKDVDTKSDKAVSVDEFVD